MQQITKFVGKITTNQDKQKEPQENICCEGERHQNRQQSSASDILHGKR
jgi:hypothetical protein